MSWIFRSSRNQSSKPYAIYLLGGTGHNGVGGEHTNFDAGAGKDSETIKHVACASGHVATSRFRMNSNMNSNHEE